MFPATPVLLSQYALDHCAPLLWSISNHLSCVCLIWADGITLKLLCILGNSFYSLYHIIDYKLLTDSLWKPQIPKSSHLLLSVLQMTIYGCHCKPLHGVFILSLILDLRLLSHRHRDWLVTGWHGQHLICPFWAPCCDHLWSYATVFVHGHPAFCFLRMYWIVNVTTPNLLCFLWWISVVF